MLSHAQYFPRLVWVGANEFEARARLFDNRKLVPLLIQAFLERLDLVGLFHFALFLSFNLLSELVYLVLLAHNHFITLFGSTSNSDIDLIRLLKSV